MRKAAFYPSDPEWISKAESKVAEALRRLPYPWRIFYHVPWRNSVKGESEDGEADFVLLHPKYGLVVVEVKGGGICLQDGKWYSPRVEGKLVPIKNPIEQAVRAKHVLRKYLKSRHHWLKWLPQEHLVVLPDISSRGRLGPMDDGTVVFYRKDVKRLPQLIEEIVAKNSGPKLSLSESQMDVLTEDLAPTVYLRVTLRDTIEEAREKIICLTTDQVRVLDGMRHNPRVIIYGAAGTGKTVLALEQAKRLAGTGHRVLLTCYNRLLGMWFQEVVSEYGEVRARHFHGLVSDLLKQAGMPIPDKPSDEWWSEKSAELLLEAAEKLKLSFDALVVDEAQDFLDTWWDALQMLLSKADASPIYAFVDPLQTIYRERWSVPFEGFRYDLVINCRNTMPIAAKVNSVFERRVPCLAADGPEPEFVAACGFEEIRKKLSKVLHRLVREEKIESQRIVVLSTRSRFAESLRKVGISSVPLISRESTRIRDDEPSNSQGVILDTVARFKGLESDVVVLLVPGLEDEKYVKLAYIGMSRARAYLVVIGPPEVGEKLGFTCL